MLIKGARAVDPANKRDEISDIRIKDGVIAETGMNLKAEPEEEIIDASGLTAAPGFIDGHCHFRDPGFEYKEDIFTGAAAAAKGGFTSVICLANTEPPVDNVDTLNYVLEKGRKTGINVYSAACISKGMNGEELTDLDSLKKAGAAVFTDDGKPLADAALTEKAMKWAAENGAVLSFHEEDPHLVGTAGVNDGKVSRALGFTKGAEASAEDCLVARDCALAVRTGARICIQHISSGVSAALVRHAKSMGADVWAEATPHHFSMTEDDVLKHGTLAKMNPPLRTEEDRRAIIEAIADGTIEVIATDHAPHSEEEKAREFAKAPSGIIGLETSFAAGYTYLVKPGYLTLSKLIERMTAGPARLYSLNAGTLSEGAPADIVLIDTEEEWLVTDDFASKSKNSPYIGETLTGKVKMTICGGKVVYDETR